MTESPDWDALIQKHLDGQTTTEDAKTLSAHIIADANVRSRYLKAAQVHGALADEVLTLGLEAEPDQTASSTRKSRAVQQFVWPQQIAAAIAAGAFAGLLGVGVVWARISAPKSKARIVNIANGDFEDFSGPVGKAFPVLYGEWGGDPAEVIERASGNRELCFLETANVSRLPNGKASSCDVFQLVDLRSLRQQWDVNNQETEVTLKLSASFRRDAQPSGTEKLRGTCRLYLFNVEPASIGNDWSMVLREAVASSVKAINLLPGQESIKISATCILEPEATVAVVHVGANPKRKNSTPIALGNCFADNVQLTLTSRPKLPVRFVK